MVQRWCRLNEICHIFIIIITYNVPLRAHETTTALYNVDANYTIYLIQNVCWLTVFQPTRIHAKLAMQQWQKKKVMFSVLTSIFSFILDLLVCSARTFFSARCLSLSHSSIWTAVSNTPLHSTIIIIHRWQTAVRVTLHKLHNKYKWCGRCKILLPSLA